MATGVIRAVVSASALSGKADKVSNATAGNFAALDANGNLIDSGKAVSVFSATNTGNTLSWNTAVKIATILGVDITAKLPTNPNTNTWRGYQIKSYSYTYSGLAAGDALEITGSNFSVSTPSGYVPAAMLRASPGTTKCVVAGFHGANTGSDSVLVIKNTSTSSAGATARVQILYLQTG